MSSAEPKGNTAFADLIRDLALAQDAREKAVRGNRTLCPAP
jgi:hypothetical protein